MLRNKLHVYGDERLEVPSHLHFGKDMLDRMAEYGDRPALINADDGEIVTFRQLADQTAHIALSLAQIGVRKGDVVSICSEKRIEVIPTILGVLCAGATFAASDITYGVVPLLHRVRIAKPKVMFLSPNTYGLHKKSFDSVGCVETYVIYGDENKDGGVLFKHFLTENADVEHFVPTPVDGWKDFTWILFSSGTTGLPKGVPWTHLATLINTFSTTNEIFENASILITREWYYTYGLMVTISSLKRGTTCIFSPRNEERDCLRAIEKYKVRVVQSAPSSINQMIKSPLLAEYDVSSVQILISSSTPVMKEQVEAISRRFVNLRGVYQIYGTSEAGNVCNEFNAPLGPKHGSVGPPSHGFIVKVVDIETRELLGPKQRGEICFKSPALTPGYIGVDTPWADWLDSEGFYKTGDVGYYDEDRYFYVLNRVKELIKYKDFSVAPAEVEGILMREPRVLDVGVAESGGRIAALVVRQPHADATSQELLDYLHDNFRLGVRLEGGVHFVPRLPRGAGDKLDRAALRQMLLHLLDDDNTNIDDSYKAKI